MSEIMEAEKEEKYERHDPEHPLPEEIKKMPRDDTVCRFCGVSYLIHNEIKALEDKLKVAETELEHYRGMEEREAKLQQRLNETIAKVNILEQNIVSRDAELSSQHSRIKDTEELLEKEKKRGEKLENLLETATQTGEMFRSKHSLYQRNLPQIKSDLFQQRAVLSGLSEDMRKQQNEFIQSKNLIQQQMLQMCKTQWQEKQNLESQVQKLEDEKNQTDSQRVELQLELEKCRSTIENLQVSTKEADNLRTQCKAFSVKIADLEKEMEEIVNQIRTSTMEKEQYKDQLRHKSEELEHMTSQQQIKDQTTAQTLTRLERKLADRESELEAAVQNLREITRKYEAKEREEQMVKDQASVNTMRTKEIHEALERAKGDAEALKAEREMMITAHQNQIEQLRESFKRRITEADRWQHKVDEALHQERQKHAKDISLLEEKLKENFVMELDIEKQKHQELLNKRMTECSDSEAKLRDELDSIQSRHQMALIEVHKQLGESKARSRETENTLRAEIMSLKNIIRDLEQRLGRLDSGGEGAVSHLKIQLRDKERQLEDTIKTNKSLTAQLAHYKEEITFLQETVRRECEERFELTEALSTAKEELMVLKRPPVTGNFVGTPRRISETLEVKSVSRPDSSKSFVSNASAASSRSNYSNSQSRSEEMTLFRKSKSSGTPVPRPPSGVKDSQSSSRENLNTSNINYNGDRAKSPDKGPRGTTMTDSRKRIAQAVGRR